MKWLDDNIGYMPGSVNIGVIKEEHQHFIVDTGIDNSAVNKVLKSLDHKVSRAYLTHHHADHMGGCSKLEKLGNVQIFVPSGELEFFVNPTLEPFTMFGGAFPPKILRNRHLEAKPVNSIQLSQEQHDVQYLNSPGHTPDHLAYLHNDVLFSGDAAFTEETITKYRLLFAVDPAQAAHSIDTLSKSKFSCMVPGHGPVQESRRNALDVLAATRRHYLDTHDEILAIIGEQLEMKEYLPKTMSALDLITIIQERGFLQYTLYKVPLMGYLKNFIDNGAIMITMENGNPTLVAN